MNKPKLYGTPLSHFTRKVRILLKEYNIEFDFIRPAEGIMGTSLNTYGDNPLMRVPALLHHEQTIIESDHIARYIVRQFDPSDRFGVRTEDTRELNRLAVANGVMANEVVIILTKRGGFEDIENITYFKKLFAAIESGLSWLEQDLSPGESNLRYSDIAIICMWQHLLHYKLLPTDKYPRIAAYVEPFNARPSISQTTPQSSSQ
jgi:glutathione S-transferase